METQIRRVFQRDVNDPLQGYRWALEDAIRVVVEQNRLMPDFVEEQAHMLKQRPDMISHFHAYREVLLQEAPDLAEEMQSLLLEKIRPHLIHLLIQEGVIFCEQLINRFIDYKILQPTEKATILQECMEEVLSEDSDNSSDGADDFHSVVNPQELPRSPNEIDEKHN
jgi:hypothetical protein